MDIAASEKPFGNKFKEPTVGCSMGSVRDPAYRINQYSFRTGQTGASGIGDQRPSSSWQASISVSIFRTRDHNLWAENASLSYSNFRTSILPVVRLPMVCLLVALLPVAYQTISTSGPKLLAQKALRNWRVFEYANGQHWKLQPSVPLFYIRTAQCQEWREVCAQL